MTTPSEPCESQSSAEGGEGSASRASQDYARVGGECDPFTEAVTAIAVRKEPILISKLIERHGDLPIEVLKLYRNINTDLLKKKTTSRADKAFLADYNEQQDALFTMLRKLEENSEKKFETRPKTRQETLAELHSPRLEQGGLPGARPTTPESRFYASIDERAPPPAPDRDRVRPLDVHKLFLRPKNFSGDPKQAREWLEDYENAASANAWEAREKAAYFPNFLADTARTWYTTRVMRQLCIRPNWYELRAQFMRFYLGTSDIFSLQRQIDESHQGEKKSIVQFLPKMLKLIELVDPLKTEEQQVFIIKSKLRSHFQKQLAPFHINTLDELTEVCLRLEGCAAATRSATAKEKQDHEKRKPTQHGGEDGAKKDKAGPNKQRGRRGGRGGGQKSSGSKVKDTSKIQCYACERFGHYASSCEFDKKADGKPKNKGNFKRPSKNVNAVEATDDKAKPEQPKVAVPLVVRSAGKPVGMVMLCNQQDESDLRTQHIVINGTGIDGVIDTAAKVSVISDKLALTHGWSMGKVKVELIGAGGESLKCVGSVEATIELEIGKTKVIVNHVLHVVSSLYFDLLIGLDLLKALRVLIDVNAERPLSFHASFHKSNGVRATSDVTLEPRSITLVQVRVCVANATTIATRPFNIDDNIMVANSVSEVHRNNTVVLVANIDHVAVALKANQQIASYEIFEEEEGKQSNVNAVMKLGDGEETIQIGEELDDRQLEELDDLLQRHRNAFLIGDNLGSTDLVKHEIRLKPDAKPIAVPLRRRPEAHIAEAKRQMRDMLERGVIEPSYAPWAAAYVIVRKKTGDFRFCVDFRGLNSVTHMDSYPLPHVDRCIEVVAGNQFYSLLDFASGYWQIPLAEEAKDLTSFRTEEGLWRFTKMPFGLCTAPASFQRLMNGLFAGMTGTNLQIFIDDMCLATPTWQEHLVLLDQVFTTVERAKLKLKGAKCLIGVREITFLGHGVSADGIQTDPNKLKALTSLPSPTDTKGVRRTMGMFSYYRKFIPNFSMIAEPLTKLQRKTAKFEWSYEQENAFRTLIAELSKKATLASLKPDLPIMLKTDASRAGIAGMLLQRQDDLWRLVSCCSRQLTSAERNYGITDLECLAIVYSVSRFHHFLYGRQFKIVTDHHALCVLTSGEPKSGRLQRWAAILMRYKFEVVYAKGNAHEDVDCLSRAPIEDSDPYCERVLAIQAPLDRDDWVAAYTDDETSSFREKAENGHNQFELRGGIVYYRNKLFVPQTERAIMLRESHDARSAVHECVEGTLARMQHLWWPRMTHDVKSHVAVCDACQRRKAERDKPSGGFFRHEASKPLDKLCLDCVGPLPETMCNKRFIIVAIDVFTRFVQAKPVASQTADKAAAFFVSYGTTFGWPKEIVTDNC